VRSISSLLCLFDGGGNTVAMLGFLLGLCSVGAVMVRTLESRYLTWQGQCGTVGKFWR
jgi:hypothetical protein